MSLHRLMKLALLAVALSLPLVAPTARADDEPSDPRTVVLKTYDVRDLGVTNDDLTALRNDDGTPWRPGQVSMKGGVLVVSGSAAEHETLVRWIEMRRGARGRIDVDQAIVDSLADALAKRKAALPAFGADAERREIEHALEVLHGPDSEARRRAVAELLRNLVSARSEAVDRTQGEDGRITYAEHASPLDDRVRKHVQALTATCTALERQQAELQRRAAVLQDLASRLEGDEPEKRKSLDTELVRIDQAAAELVAKREALMVQKAELESALAEQRRDDMRRYVSRLDAAAREREASRSARWPQANTSQGPIPENEILLEEVRALRRDVREVKTLLRKLLERDGVAVDPRAAR